MKCNCWFDIDGISMFLSLSLFMAAWPIVFDSYKIIYTNNTVFFANLSQSKNPAQPSCFTPVNFTSYLKLLEQLVQSIQFFWYPYCKCDVLGNKPAERLVWDSDSDSHSFDFRLTFVRHSDLVSAIIWLSLDIQLY